jgi:hypothetical protein
MASGMPSSRWQMREIVSALPSLSANSGCTAVARSTNSVTASYWPSSSGGSRASSGIDIVGIWKMCSPVSPRACLLVARMRTPAAP